MAYAWLWAINGSLTPREERERREEGQALLGRAKISRIKLKY